MYNPSQITKNNDTGLIVLYEGIVPIASCKDTAVIQPIVFASNNNMRGFRVFTGAPQGTSVSPQEYTFFDFGINDLTQILVGGSTTYNFTPPQSNPTTYNASSYLTAYSAVFTRLTASIFRSCCPTVVNVTGDGVIFYDDYPTMAATVGLPDIIYILKDGGGQYIWDTTISDFVPLYYPHPSITLYALNNFI